MLFRSSYSGDLQPTNMPLEIGVDPTGSLDYFNGTLDKLRIYRKALSAADIKELSLVGTPVKGTAFDLLPVGVSCSDITTGQGVTFSSSGPWNCEKHGLTVNNQDQIVITISGAAQSGMAQVVGSVSDLLPARVSCSDVTTGQSVTFSSSGYWNCEKHGLQVVSQDQIRIAISGTAQK